MNATATTPARVTGTHLRMAGYECDWSGCPATGVQLFQWAHVNKRKHPDLVKRLREWGNANGHRDLLTVWSPAAVADALRWLVDSASE